MARMELCTDTAMERLVILPTEEQVFRGQELLRLLNPVSTPSGAKTTPAKFSFSQGWRSAFDDRDPALASAPVSEEDSEASTEARVIVRRTFIEVVGHVDTPTLSRSFSDSALEVSPQPWRKNAQHVDLSDASTNVSLEADEPEAAVLWARDKPVAAIAAAKVVATSAKGQRCVNGVGGRRALVRGEREDNMPPSTGQFFLTKTSASGQGSPSPVVSPQSVVPAVPVSSAHSEWRTTVMLRNMPNNYTRMMLLELMDSKGFEGAYDFAYLPVDFSSQAGLGYAFINFTSSSKAQACFDLFEGFSAWSVPSDKRCTVAWSSPHQGLLAHIERYQNSPVMHHSMPDEWKPILLKNGQRVPFPLPTKTIKTPKLHQHSAAKALC